MQFFNDSAAADQEQWTAIPMNDLNQPSDYQQQLRQSLLKSPNSSYEDDVDSSNNEGERLLMTPFGLVKGMKRQKLQPLLFVAGLLIIMSFALCLRIILGPYDDTMANFSIKNRRNVILMVSDGFGFASQTMARTFYQQRHNVSITSDLPLDSILRGSVRTRSHSSPVTDSAAGATAYSCGYKTYNTAIGVFPNGSACGTIMESAHRRKYITGVVSTARISDATPAAFSAHTKTRYEEEEILKHMLFGYKNLGRSLDFIFGGNACYMRPKSSGGCRVDGRNLIQEAKQIGWKTILDRKTFDQFNATTSDTEYPILALFNTDDMSYEIDRKLEDEPSLAEMAAKALESAQHKLQTSADYNGFFVMIEGARIDVAGHLNDPGAQVWEVLAYNEAIEVAKRFVDQHPGTVLISLSDHCTGGLALARQMDPRKPIYNWNTENLHNIKKSCEVASQELKNILTTINKTDNRQLGKQNFPLILEYLEQNLAISRSSKYAVTDRDLNSIIKFATETSDNIVEDGQIDLSQYLALLVSKNVEVGWSTHGHTAVDIGLYIYDGLTNVRDLNYQSYKPLEERSFFKGIPSFLSKPKERDTISYHNYERTRNLVQKLSGNIENTYISNWIAEYLDLDAEEITRLIK